MASMIERPSFYEGQILAGADLNAAVDHARGQAARHERYLHLWGIAQGLDLKGDDKKTASGVAYKEITVTAGMAVDASGREIVVPADTRLPDEVFDQLNVSVGQLPGAVVWYPVFVTGRDSVPAAPALSVGQCGSSEPKRRREDIQLDFGRPGDEGKEQDEAATADGPDSGSATPRRVLLGFVLWNTAIAKFSDVKPAHEGIGRRYAGVQADTVAARGGSLAFRTRFAVTKGKPGLVLNEVGDGLLAYGSLTATGEIAAPVFSVNAKGDLTIGGKFTGAVTPGSVQVQSGVAMDGVILPLPPGITQEMLDKGQATAHVQVTARVPPSAEPPIAAPDWVACPRECVVDSSRRVRCTVRWITSGGALVDLPGECDYLVLVSVSAA
jgi:hypothetical protein